MPEPGRVLFVEHDPVITISNRAGASNHLIATPEALAALGVTIERTDRGGDITYHGPGQLVVYPILDLNLLNLGLHAYMRLLEAAVIDTCAAFGIEARRDASATGVWIGDPGAKICAMGVRVRRWVSLHGLALNVATDLSHFDLIVPCGLVGRPVTSLERELGRRGAPAPSISEVADQLAMDLDRHIAAAKAAAESTRAAEAARRAG
jgi:lipoyl(octanoyl) transferase